jgi:hypothetical protein
MDDAVADNVIEATDYEVDYYSSSSDIINGINNGGTKVPSGPGCVTIMVKGLPLP